jgi:Cytochrome P460
MMKAAAVLIAMGLATVAVVGSMVLAAGLGDLPQNIQAFAKWQKLVTTGLPTDGPHAGKNKVVYGNSIAAKAWKGSEPLPLGSLVVKTVGLASKPTLVALMEKRQDGWYYAEWLPNNKGGYNLAFGGPGKQALCVDCHGNAEKDALFTRK